MCSSLAFAATLPEVAGRQGLGILNECCKMALAPHFEALGHSAADVLSLPDGSAFIQDYRHKDHMPLGVGLAYHDALQEGGHHSDKFIADGTPQAVVP